MIGSFGKLPAGIRRARLLREDQVIVMSKQELAATATAMVAPGKRLLVTDESKRTCSQRFEDLGIAPTEENRRA